MRIGIRMVKKYKKNFENNAVVDFPLRLLIIVIILAITIPLVLNAFFYYTTEQRRNMLQNIVLRISNTAVQTYNFGLNGSQSITVEPPSGTEYVKIGAPLGNSDCAIIRYKLINDMEYLHLVRDGNKAVFMTSDRNDTFEFSAGLTTIIFRKTIANYDVDGNSKIDDFYIEVRSGV